MDTRTLLRERLRRARDWATAIDELEKELEASGGKPDQSERLFELARLTEDVIPSESVRWACTSAPGSFIPIT